MKPNLILPSQNMNIIRFALVLPLILLAILPFGCRQDESKIRIGVSVPKTTAPIYTLMREKMIELGKAEKHNVEIIWHGAEDQGSKKNHIAREKQQIEEMLNLNIKVLILKPLAPNSAYTIVSKAKNRKPPVPVISLDQMITGVSTYGHIDINEISIAPTLTANLRPIIVPFPSASITLTLVLSDSSCTGLELVLSVSG